MTQEKTKETSIPYTLRYTNRLHIHKFKSQTVLQVPDNMIAVCKFDMRDHSVTM